MKNIKAHSNLRVANYPFGMNKGPNLKVEYVLPIFFVAFLGLNQFYQVGLRFALVL